MPILRPGKHGPHSFGGAAGLSKGMAKRRCSAQGRHTGIIYHPGGTNSFSSYLGFYPASETGTCVLSNMNSSANTVNMGTNILRILEGEEALVFGQDIWTTIDIVAMAMMVAGLAFIIIFALLWLGRRKKFLKPHRRAWLIIPFIFIALYIALLIMLPASFHSTLGLLILWGPYSLLPGLIAFALGLLAMLGCLLASTRKSRERGKAGKQ